MVVALVNPIDVRRDTEFYRPQLDELPNALKIGLQQMLADDHRHFDMEYTRVLGYRHPEAQAMVVLGLYSMMQVSEIHFELRKWRVVEEYRRQSFGRRLLGHALGLAESKGGRRVTVSVPSDRSREIEVLTRYGFAIVQHNPVGAGTDTDQGILEGTTDLVFEVLPE